jgi:hypothetical protein
MRIIIVAGCTLSPAFSRSPELVHQGAIRRPRPSFRCGRFRGSRSNLPGSRGALATEGPPCGESKRLCVSLRSNREKTAFGLSAVNPAENGDGHVQEQSNREG